MQPLNGALPGPYVPVRVTRAALVAHRYTYVPPRCSAGPLFPSATIWLTPYSMVWDCGLQEQGQCCFVSLSYSIPTIVFCFPLSLLSVYMLVLWNLGLWTDRVYITLSQPCTADLF